MKNYFLGLDIGTNSVGYAVTDEDYNILRIKGQKAWGVRLFEKAETAVLRRTKRSNRRRLDRRKLKIKWLQEIFAPEIEKIDKNFLARIRCSNLWLEDKKGIDENLTKDSLFYGKIDGKLYTDKEFHNEYPTIYHLRKELLNKEAKDARFLYLAVHNIIKRRGHFLYGGDFGENVNFVQTFNKCLEFFGELAEDEVNLFSFNKLDDDAENKIIEVLKDNKGIKDTKQKFYEIFNASDKNEKKIIDIIAFGKVNTSDIFVGIESEENLKFSFSDDNFETEIYGKLSDMLSDSQLELIDKLRELYSILSLKKIIKDSNFICEAMVEKFDLHKKQLDDFQQFIRKFYPSKYYDMFRNSLTESGKTKYKFINYPLYVNRNDVGGKKQVLGLSLDSGVQRTKDEFYKYVKSVLQSEPENKDDETLFENEKSNILKLIENDNFLPKQRTKDNSVLPNKLYEKELRQILNSNTGKFAFLSETDETGLSNYDKIIEILNFRVPYFVGPVGKFENAENVFGWAERNSNLKLYPWTLSKIVDFDKSEDKFIEKMINKCTYFSDEQVLPKRSILYSKFRVFNELNKLKINGDSISVELKQSIFKNLFENNKTVSIKMLKEFLINEGLFSKEEIKDVKISGIDKGFANDYSTFYLFAKIFGKEFVNKNADMIEAIVKYLTIMNDKNRLQKRLEKEFGDKLTPTQIKQIKALSFSDWGSLSEEFLSGFKFTNKRTGEVTNIISELWNTNSNLQEILYDDSYTLKEDLESRNAKNVEELTYQSVEELYCSPAVKRGVWQALQIVNEITKLMGSKPDKIFVEVTRHDEEKGEAGRKLSRKDNLLKQYNSAEFKKTVKKIGFDIDKLVNELNKTDNKSLRSEKLYLYFLQLGKCAYSGEPIDLENLYDDEYYDVDHIIPQALIKDDSIKNKVLVKGKYNKEKSDTYPICSQFDWAGKMVPFWKNLLDLKLMPDEKYANLIRKEPLSNEELGGFIARQLVETNQTAKSVIDLLKTMLDSTRDVVYSKSKNATTLKEACKIEKSREVNDFHHARDAYFNIVAGNVLFNRFTNNPRNFYSASNKNNEKTKNIKKLFYFTVTNYLTGNVVWRGTEDIARIAKIASRNDCVVSNMSFSNINGAFYDETVYKSKKNDENTKAKISLKDSGKNPLKDFEKYGGYNNMKTAYFMLVESSDKKGNRIKTIETVPIYAIRKFKNDPDSKQKIFEYVASENKLTDAKVLIEKINIQSTLKIDKGEYLLAGKTGNQYILHNANEWHISNEDTKYVKAIEKYIDLKIKKLDDSIEEKDDKVVLSPKSKEHNTEIALIRDENLNLYNVIKEQLQKEIYAGFNLANIGNMLVQNEEMFVALSVKEQAEVLFNLIKLVYAGANTADLKLIGGSAGSGKILLNKNITGKNIWLIKRSCTGLIESKIKL